MNWPPDRFGDNRWNQCLDALIAAWNRAGPDATLGALRDLELAPAAGDRPVPRQYRAAAPGVLKDKPSGTCPGCGEVILLRGNGLVRSHRLSAFGGSAGCDGSGQPPAEDAATGEEPAA